MNIQFFYIYIKKNLLEDKAVKKGLLLKNSRIKESSLNMTK